MSKNMYYKKPKFGINTRHNLHGQFSPFHLCIFVLNWQRDFEFRIVSFSQFQAYEKYCPGSYRRHRW